MTRPGIKTFTTPRFPSSNAIAVLIGMMLSTSLAHAQLTRQQAVEALFAPGSGVAIDTTNSVVWSPFVDFGSGPGFEGLLPTGSTVEPQEVGWLPWPGPGHAVTAPAYFFWIDDAPDALFQHPVRFVLVQAAIVSPTVANGGIVVSAQGWWPAVTTPSGVRTEFFATDQARATDQPSGFANPNGHIAGPAGHPSQLAPGAAPLPAAAPFAPAAPAPAPAANNACGLIIRGSPDAHMGTTAMFYESDLRDHYRVPTNRIIKANGGMAATCAQVDAAISNLCSLMPSCDKIYVRLVSHGSIGGFTLADGSISASNLCVKFRKLAVKGVPICLVINCCYSGSLLTDPLNWNFPAGSSIITATDSNHQARGSSMPYTLGTNTNITGSLYPHAFSACLRDARADRDGNGQVDDCEAFDWVRSQKPCYIWSGDGGRRYPAGPPAGQVGENPGPQKILVGRNPSATALTVCNGTGADKTDFHIVYQGNVTNGLRARSTRALQDGTPFPQLGWTNAATITYDSTNDQTMVCWSDTNNPVAPGSYVNFIVVDPQRRLRPVRQFWTPSAVPPPPTNRAPGQRAMLLPGSTPATARVLVTGIGDGDDPQATAWRAMTAPAPIPEGNLYGSSPAVQVLVSTDLGAFEVSPNQSAQFDAPVTSMPNAPLPTLILRSDSFWEVNSTRVTALYQLNLDTPAEDTTCLTNCPGTGVFFGVNPPGPNPTFQWFKDGQLIEGETNGTLRLLDLRGMDQGTYTGIATSGPLVKRRFFKLFIEDNTPPTLNCPSNIIVECPGPNGTSVNYQVSASDNCGGRVTLECDPPPGSLFPPGTTFVSCIARDTFQNSAVCTFVVTVVDTTPPEIQCPTDRTFTAPSSIIFSFTPGVFDNCDPNPVILCMPPSGSAFPPETTTPIRCTARDSSGNQSECSFNVTVRRPGGSRVNLTRNGNNLRVTWGDANGRLQQAGCATGPWMNVPNATSPYDVTFNPEISEQYYRLFFPDAQPPAR